MRRKDGASELAGIRVRAGDCPRPRDSPPLALVFPSLSLPRSSPERSPAAVASGGSSLRGAGSPVTRPPAGPLSCFSGKLAPAASLPSPLPPRRLSGLRDSAFGRSERVPGTPPRGWCAAPLSFPPRPARGPAAGHPTPSSPRHPTPPPSPTAPRSPRPGPASVPETTHSAALSPGKKKFTGAHSSGLAPPALVSPPPARSFSGEGGCRLGLKAIDLYVFVPALEAARAARAGAAAAARGVPSLLP